MSTPSVTFNKKDQPEFFKVLNKRVNQYFQDKGISKKGNLNMKIKTIFMLFLYFTPFVLMLTGVVTGFWPIIGMWAIMGLGMSGLGLAVMHDANHGSYSSNQKVNDFVGFIIHFIGGYHINWKIQHNVLHHSFTNVEGFDEDIEAGVMRFSPAQERKGIFKYQVFYAPFLYALLTLNWFFVKDFDQLSRYKEKDLLKTQNITYGQAIRRVIFHKIWYFLLFIVLPIAVLSISWWQVMLGFLLMHFICGEILSLIFQPAHVLEETDFYETDESGSIENNWAVHQVRTTANFGNGSKWFTWFVGGLNHQVEHHLFPHICHVHYPEISKIIKETTAEFNLPYHQHKTFFGALRSHFTLLHKLGTGKYDQELARA